MKRRFFQGNRGGVPLRADERCNTCGVYAAMHPRDIEGGTDRFVCPSEEVINDRPAIREDRIANAVALARGLVGNKGPTIDQSAPQPTGESSYDYAYGYYDKSQGRMNIAGAVRAGKSNPIRSLMRGLTRDQVREQNRLQQEINAKQARQQLEKQKYLAMQQARDRQAQVNKALDLERETITFSGYVYPNYSVRMTNIDPSDEPAKPKPQPTVPINARRRYFEE